MVTNKETIHYDELSDTLTISFQPNVIATGVELNDQLLLRIDKEQNSAVGLVIFDYSLISQQTDIGRLSVPLSGLAQLSKKAQRQVITILQSSPVNQYLSLSAYSSNFSELVPISSVHALPIAA